MSGCVILEKKKLPALLKPNESNRAEVGVSGLGLIHDGEWVGLNWSSSSSVSYLVEMTTRFLGVVDLDLVLGVEEAMALARR